MFYICRNEGIGMAPGEVEKDEEGKRTMRNLGRNMAYVLKKLHHPGSADVKPPEVGKL
jgi:hypothetical protein